MSTLTRYRRRGKNSDHEPGNPIQIPKTPCLWFHLPPQQRLLPAYAYPSRTTKSKSTEDPLQTNPRHPQLELPHRESGLFQREFHAAPPNTGRRSERQIFRRKGSHEREVYEVLRLA